MSFVYMPIPGCSVRTERQLRAGLGPWLACRRPGRRALGMGKATLMDLTTPAQRFEGFLACYC